MIEKYYAAHIKTGLALRQLSSCGPARTRKAVKLGIGDFRENLAGYLVSRKSLAIRRHGETMGFYIPAPKPSRKAEFDAMRAAARISTK